MKKVCILFVFIFGVNTLVFSNSEATLARVSEASMSLGFKYGSFFERYTGENVLTSYTGSPGIAFHGYHFRSERNIGIFALGFFGFPVIRDSPRNYFSRFQTGLVIGPAFRYNFNERLTLKYAIGISWSAYTLAYTETVPLLGNTEFDIWTNSLGIGANWGIKYDLNNTFFISAGSVFTFDFFKHIILLSNVATSSGWARNSFTFGTKPYITFGINIDHYGLSRVRR